MQPFDPEVLATILFFHANLIGIPGIIAASITAAVALAAKRLLHSPAHHLLYVAIGSALPLLMLGGGLYLAFPWPWWLPKTLPIDGFPPGPILAMAGYVSWPFTLWLARAILLRRRRG
ncbi:hypothetical protein [Sphingomonas sp. BK069]|uniref:hypothetical protein n=1 Tax=Sphingomonas sp. BK069 TaxID=2586979 RepID=UPI0016173CE5|nr:hypothetical protein [Sphingomonas sp. BK069]MBB3349838.1 CHASE2 domain-containing sensor protein [Sphingomonas sp. BK069]